MKIFSYNENIFSPTDRRERVADSAGHPEIMEKRKEEEGYE